MIQGLNLDAIIKRTLLSQDFNRLWDNAGFDADLQRCINLYGIESRDLYLKPFTQIQEISDGYIDDILNTLCYFYPDYIGDYVDPAKCFCRPVDTIFCPPPIFGTMPRCAAPSVPLYASFRATGR